MEHFLIHLANTTPIVSLSIWHTVYLTDTEGQFLIVSKFTKWWPLNLQMMACQAKLVSQDIPESCPLFPKLFNFLD